MKPKHLIEGKIQYFRTFGLNTLLPSVWAFMVKYQKFKNENSWRYALLFFIKFWWWASKPLKFISFLQCFNALNSVLLFLIPENCLCIVPMKTGFQRDTSIWRKLTEKSNFSNSQMKRGKFFWEGKFINLQI